MYDFNNLPDLSIEFTFLLQSLFIDFFKLHFFLNGEKNVKSETSFWAYFSAYFVLF